VFFWNVMVRQFKIRPLTSRQRAHLEEQRLRNVSAAFARLQKALDNMMRPAWGSSTPDRLAYLQAKFGRRVSDSGSRSAAAVLIEKWRRRSMSGGPKLDPERPINDWTDGELMMAVSVRHQGQHVAKPEDPPRASPREWRANNQSLTSQKKQFTTRQDRAYRFSTPVRGLARDQARALPGNDNQRRGRA
jgi:hypothetical protein